jgi:ABC-type antimicrobial peptide transport system permease subunit
VLVCSIAGILGIGIGFLSCELLIYIASNVLPNLEFAWVFHPGAWAASSLATLGVGILSGIVPAWRAEKLEVIEALRSE